MVPSFLRDHRSPAERLVAALAIPDIEHAGHVRIVFAAEPDVVADLLLVAVSRVRKQVRRDRSRGIAEIVAEPERDRVLVGGDRQVGAHPAFFQFGKALRRNADAVFKNEAFWLHIEPRVHGRFQLVDRGGVAIGKFRCSAVLRRFCDLERRTQFV